MSQEEEQLTEHHSRLYERHVASHLLYRVYQGQNNPKSALEWYVDLVVEGSDQKSEAGMHFGPFGKDQAHTFLRIVKRGCSKTWVTARGPFAADTLASSEKITTTQEVYSCLDCGMPVPNEDTSCFRHF